ncbi:MAG: hypothetical protein R6X15_06260 [Pseudomonadota bacterium]
MKTRIAITLVLFLTALNAVAADVACLSTVDARAVLASEREGPYFSLLHPREMVAKTGQQPAAGTLKAQREWVRATYAKSVRDCSDGEREALESYVAHIESEAAQAYPGLFKIPWRFVKVTASVEGGLPHTVGRAIVLSEPFFQSLEASASPENMNLKLMNILIHEQVHVLQRADMKPYKSIYRKEFGFRKAANITGFESWRASHQVVNPDGVDVSWVWPVPDSNRVIWPLIVLMGENNTPRMPDDFGMIGIELAEGENGFEVVAGESGEPRYRSLREESDYMAKFRGISSLYHPNEIAANYIADMVVWDCLLDKSEGPQQKVAAIEAYYRQVRPWVEQLLGN